MIAYLIHVNIALGIFYIMSIVLFKNLTFFKMNRAFILLVPLLTIIIPFVEFGFIASTSKTLVSGYVSELPAIFIGNEKDSFNFITQ